MKKIGFTQRRYSKEFKQSIQKKILLGEFTAIEACKQYGIGRTTIYRWIGELEAKKSDIYSMSDEKFESKELLEKRIKKLEEALKLSELKSEAYKNLIKKAESQFKIVIEKKCGPK